MARDRFPGHVAWAWEWQETNHRRRGRLRWARGRRRGMTREASGPRSRKHSKLSLPCAFVLLNPGERIISTDPVGWFTIPGIPTNSQGYLHLTNLRLVFEAMIGGTLVNLDLRQITDVHAVVGESGEPAVMIHCGSWVCVLGTVNAGRCANWIASARYARLTPPPTEPASATDSTTPRVYLHCRHCGTLNPAGTSRCTSCGATL